MKDELKKYLESQTRKNEQDIHIRELGLKLGKAMIIICIIGIFVAIFALIFTI